MLKLAALIERDADDLATLEALDAGVLYRESKGLHVTNAVETLRYFAGWADKIQGKAMGIGEGGAAHTRREPIGVCGVVVPWNAPLCVFFFSFFLVLFSNLDFIIFIFLLCLQCC